MKLSFALWAALLGLVGALPAGQERRARAAPRKPNVLFIAVDDLRPELGCYGNSEIKTPNMDRLAARGVRFDRAYCQQAVCNPSRASLLTGLRPDACEVWDLRVHFRDTVPDVVTLPEHFRANGYRAVAYGKIYHNPLPDRRSWDEPNHWAEGVKNASAASLKQLEQHRAKMDADGASEAAIERMRPPALEDEDVADDARADGALCTDALAALRALAAGKQPFFLAVGFVKPHLPFNAPRRWWDLYDPQKLSLAPNPFLPKDVPPPALDNMYELRDYIDFAGTPEPTQAALALEQQRRLKQGYYACVSYTDAQVGRLLQALDELKLWDDTLVVLWGDHGWKLGEHRAWCKQTNFETDTRAPLIVRAPGAKANGKGCDALVEFVDIYPTLCDLAGLPRPAHLQGASLKPLLDDPSGSVKEAAFSQFLRIRGKTRYMGYAMRTERWRFVQWYDWQSGELAFRELYDHASDSQENVNLAATAEAATLAELDATMKRLYPPSFHAQWPGLRSRASKEAAQLEFRNALGEPLLVYGIDERGARQLRKRLAPGETHVADTFVGHVFVLESESGGYLRSFAVESAETRVVTAELAH